MGFAFFGGLEKTKARSLRRVISLVECLQSRIPLRLLPDRLRTHWVGGGRTPTRARARPGITICRLIRAAPRRDVAPQWGETERQPYHFPGPYRSVRGAAKRREWPTDRWDGTGPAGRTAVFSRHSLSAMPLNSSPVQRRPPPSKFLPDIICPPVNFDVATCLDRS